VLLVLWGQIIIN